MERSAPGHDENSRGKAARELPKEALRTGTLYASADYAMCAGAICRARVPRVVYGCSSQGLRDLIGGGTAVPCRQILERPNTRSRCSVHCSRTKAWHCIVA